MNMVRIAAFICISPLVLWTARERAFFIPGRGDQFRGGLQAQSVNRRSFISSTLSSPAMALTVDSTEWLAARTVSGVMLSKAKIRCSFSPSALRMCESAVCCRATDSNRSVMA